MQRHVLTVEASESVAAALAMMETSGVEQLTVMDGERAMGLVTGDDLHRALTAARAPYTELENRWFGSERIAGSVTVRSAVSSAPLVPPNRVACEAARALADSGAPCVIVVEQGAVVGVAGSA
jgi:CBS domain-containing protein